METSSAADIAQSAIPTPRTDPTPPPLSLHHNDNRDVTSTIGRFTSPTKELTTPAYHAKSKNKGLTCNPVLQTGQTTFKP